MSRPEGFSIKGKVYPSNSIQTELAMVEHITALEIYQQVAEKQMSQLEDEFHWHRKRREEQKAGCERLLDVVECLIDTCIRTTDLENIYDDAREKSASWDEVWESYRYLKKLADVDQEVKA